MKHADTRDFEYDKDYPRASASPKRPGAPKKEKGSNVPLFLAAIVIAALLFVIMRIIGWLASPPVALHAMPFARTRPSRVRANGLKSLEPR